MPESGEMRALASPELSTPECPAHRSLDGGDAVDSVRPRFSFARGGAVRDALGPSAASRPIRHWCRCKLKDPHAVIHPRATTPEYCCQPDQTGSGLGGVAAPHLDAVELPH